jgi:hypothetical protein
MTYCLGGRNLCLAVAAGHLYPVPNVHNDLLFRLERPLLGCCCRSSCVPNVHSDLLTYCLGGGDLCLAVAAGHLVYTMYTVTSCLGGRDLFLAVAACHQ